MKLFNFIEEHSLWVSVAGVFVGFAMLLVTTFGVLTWAIQTEVRAQVAPDVIENRHELSRVSKTAGELAVAYEALNKKIDRKFEDIDSKLEGQRTDVKELRKIWNEETKDIIDRLKSLEGEYIE